MKTANVPTWTDIENFSFFLCRDFKRQYLSQSPTRIGGKYKKAVYTQYKDETFTEKSENKQRKNELGILGPVIRAQIRDIITVREHVLKPNYSHLAYYEFNYYSYHSTWSHEPHNSKHI